MDHIMILVDGKPFAPYPDAKVDEVLKLARDAGDVSFAEVTSDGLVPVDLARDPAAPADREAG